MKVSCFGPPAPPVAPPVHHTQRRIAELAPPLPAAGAKPAEPAVPVAEPAEHADADDQLHVQEDAGPVAEPDAAGAVAQHAEPAELDAEPAELDAAANDGATAAKHVANRVLPAVAEPEERPLDAQRVQQQAEPPLAGPPAAEPQGIPSEPTVTAPMQVVNADEHAD